MHALFVLFVFLTIIVTIFQWAGLFYLVKEDELESQRMMISLLIPWGFLVILNDYVLSKEMEKKDFKDIKVCEEFCASYVKGYKALDEAERLIIADRCKTWHDIFSRSKVIS